MDVASMIKLLERAQVTYGYPNQIMVAAEECCELAAVLTKYPRYDTHDDAMQNLRPKILEEVADVYVVLQHVHMIFGLTPQEVETAMDVKLQRLKRWLDSSDSMQRTTEDRELGDTAREVERV